MLQVCSIKCIGSEGLCFYAAAVYCAPWTGSLGRLGAYATSYLVEASGIRRNWPMHGQRGVQRLVTCWEKARQTVTDPHVVFLWVKLFFFNLIFFAGSEKGWKLLAPKWLWKFVHQSSSVPQEGLQMQLRHLPQQMRRGLLEGIVMSPRVVDMG